MNEDPAARVAWSYLGVLAALVVSALVMVIGSQLAVPLACTSGDPEAVLTCQLAWGGLLGLVGLLAGLAGALAVMRLAWWGWAWLLLVAGTAVLVGLLDKADQWWFWALAAALPALAALSSQRWSARFWGWQRVGITGVVLIGVVSSAAWLLPWL